MRFLVFENRDRWTKLIRRSFRKSADVQIAMIPGLRMLDEILSAETGNFVLLDVTAKNVDEVIWLVTKHSNSAQNHRFIGYCQESDAGFNRALRQAGVVACTFSLIDVKSVVRAARRHFSNTKAGWAVFSGPLSLEEKIWLELPDF